MWANPSLQRSIRFTHQVRRCNDQHMLSDIPNLLCEQYQPVRHQQKTYVDGLLWDSGWIKTLRSQEWRASSNVFTQKSIRRRLLSLRLHRHQGVPCKAKLAARLESLKIQPATNRATTNELHPVQLQFWELFRHAKRVGGMSRCGSSWWKFSGFHYEKLKWISIS